LGGRRDSSLANVGRSKLVLFRTRGGNSSRSGFVARKKKYGRTIKGELSLVLAEVQVRMTFETLRDDMYYCRREEIVKKTVKGKNNS